MRHDFPGFEVRENLRYVDNGRIIASAEISAGIDMALRVVAHLGGPDAARQVACAMEIAWPPAACPRSPVSRAGRPVRRESTARSESRLPALNKPAHEVRREAQPSNEVRNPA